MNITYSVLDGAPHTGTVLDHSLHIREWTVAGVTYRDTGLLHAHEQHDLVRWFRRSDPPVVKPEHA
jgi:hypothetical protein